MSDIQRRLNGHMSMIQKGFCIGEDWGQEDRIRETTINHSNAVPPMYIMVKDHKVVAEGKLPKTRPVVSNCRGMGVHISNTISDIVEGLANSLEGEFEVISSEDLKARLDEYNQELGSCRIPEGELRMILGVDAIGLFPSLDTRKVARIVADNFLRSDLTVDNVDYLELAKYIALNWTEGRIKLEGLQRVCPTRKCRKGARPGLGSKEAQGARQSDNQDSRWEYRTLDQTREEERKLVAATLEISISASFDLHVYTFGGRVYRQRSGGPIGSRLTMAVARVVMAAWGRKMEVIIKEGGMEIMLAACYVDDIRYIITMLDKDMYWSTDEKRWRDRRDKMRIERRVIKKVNWSIEEKSFVRSEEVEEMVKYNDKCMGGPIHANMTMSLGPNGLEGQTTTEEEMRDLRLHTKLS